MGALLLRRSRAQRTSRGCFVRRVDNPEDPVYDTAHRLLGPYGVIGYFNALVIGGD